MKVERDVALQTGFPAQRGTGAVVVIGAALVLEQAGAGHEVGGDGGGAGGQGWLFFQAAA